jgi:hypothetical protein
MDVAVVALLVGVVVACATFFAMVTWSLLLSSARCCDTATQGVRGGKAPRLLQTLQILIYLHSNNSFNTQNFIHHPVGC